MQAMVLEAKQLIRSLKSSTGKREITETGGGWGLMLVASSVSMKSDFFKKAFVSLFPQKVYKYK